MKRAFFCLTLLFLLRPCLHSDAEEKTPAVNPSVKLLFHNIGGNALHSLTYNYGLNFMLAGAATWAAIETGLDWKWRNIAYNNAWVSQMGRPGLYIGYVIPAITPGIAYLAGRLTKNDKLQITGLALTQSLLLTLAIQTPIKMISGRALPGIVTELDHTRNSRADNLSGEFNWFNSDFIGGWPSGHTANAFAAAATISELYSDNLWLNVGVYSYAALIGIGVTLDVHWASDALAGALIGYAVGKTVGKSFKQLLEKPGNKDSFLFYATPNGMGVVIRL